MRLQLVVLIPFATLLAGTACNEEDSDPGPDGSDTAADATDTGSDSADAAADTAADAAPDAGPETSNVPADAAPSGPQVSDLVAPGGCGDLTMTMGSADGDLDLVFSYRGELAKAAHDDPSGTAELTQDLAVEGSLQLHQGVQVRDLACNDALTGNEEIQRTWVAVAGTVHVTIASDKVHEPWDAYPGTGTITLTDVVLRSDGVADVVIPTLSWTATIGWLPG